jgi:hypothetical protein
MLSVLLNTSILAIYGLWKSSEIVLLTNRSQYTYYCWQITRATFVLVFVMPNGGSCLKVHTSDHEWPRMTTSDHEWPRVTTSDHEWPQVTTSDHEWPRMTTSDHEWPRVISVSKNHEIIIKTILRWLPKVFALHCTIVSRKRLFLRFT